MPCLLEKFAEASHHIIHSFSLVDFLVVLNSALFCCPSEVKTVAYELCVLIIKLMQFLFHDVHFVEFWSFLLNFKKLLMSVKSAVLQVPSNSAPNLRNLFQQVNLFILNSVWILEDFLKNFCFNILMALNSLPNFIFLIPF